MPDGKAPKPQVSDPAESRSAHRRHRRRHRAAVLLPKRSRQKAFRLVVSTAGFVMLFLLIWYVLVSRPSG